MKQAHFRLQRYQGVLSKQKLQSHRQIVPFLKAAFLPFLKVAFLLFLPGSSMPFSELTLFVVHEMYYLDMNDDDSNDYNNDVTLL